MNLPSPYGPLFTLPFEPLSRLPLPVVYWAWKGEVVACALVALVVVPAGLKPSFAAVGAVILLAFGGALPAIGVQDSLVNPLSLPNVIGALTGHGGADPAVRGIARSALVAVTLGATAVVAWRRAWAIPAIGILLFVSVLALSWVMPWYLREAELVN